MPDMYRRVITPLIACREVPDAEEPLPTAAPGPPPAQG